MIKTNAQKNFKRLTKKTKQEKMTLKDSTKPSRSGSRESRPTETGVFIKRNVIIVYSKQFRLFYPVFFSRELSNE
jgi:hypothetical protein